MQGSGEAPALPTYSQLAQPQVAAPIIAQPQQPVVGAQDQADNEPTSQHAVDKESDKDASGLVLPLARIKRIIKSEGDVKAVSSEASFAVARAAELLLEELARRANIQMQTQHRSTLQYKDVATAVHDWKALLFLADIVPQPVAVSTLLEKYRQQHPELVYQQPNGVATGALAANGQHSQTAQQPMQPPAQQLGQQAAQHPQSQAQQQPQQLQQQQQQQAQQQGVPLHQRPVQSIFAQPHAQHAVSGQQQLAQLVHPARMQHFPVAEQVQQLLPPRLPVSTAATSLAGQHAQTSAGQPSALSQYQSLGHLQLLSQRQVLAQQQALAKSAFAHQQAHQQAQQQALAQQAASQQQQQQQQALPPQQSVAQARNGQQQQLGLQGIVQQHVQSSLPQATPAVPQPAVTQQQSLAQQQALAQHQALAQQQALAQHQALQPSKT